MLLAFAIPILPSPGFLSPPPPANCCTATTPHLEHCENVHGGSEGKCHFFIDGHYGVRLLVITDHCYLPLLSARGAADGFSDRILGALGVAGAA
jgi:hypothetical protein